MDVHAGLVEDLFRRESAHLVAALARLLGPAHIALAEDVVQDALVSAMHAWRFGPPSDPKAWILQVAKHRAIDVLRRERRRDALVARDRELQASVELALSPAADDENQLAMMFAICDGALSVETHVTVILRLLCGLSATEIARAFLVEVPTIDRRLHRGRARLQTLGELVAPTAADVRARQPSVEQALYLLFNEGYQGSDLDNPIHPAMCADALRLAELLLAAAVEPATVHALAALFCLTAVRLATRLDSSGTLVPLAEQDRTRWDRGMIARGVRHLAASATGERWTRWHLEAGIALEHATAASVDTTDWEKVVAYYDALLALCPGPIVALNRALALGELRGTDAGELALAAVDDPRLTDYSLYWAGLADLARRASRTADAIAHYQRAATLARSHAERRSYERRLRELASG